MGKTWKSIFWEENQELSLLGSIKLEMSFPYLMGDIKTIIVTQVWSSLVVVGEYGLKIKKKVLIINSVVI